ncbi:MAG: ankyrin repeat domain-containing protein [Acidobacteria bacterium]|nr:ankyrin repeat domain-containing protein [Acidobacteriota bacterium]
MTGRNNARNAIIVVLMMVSTQLYATVNDLRLVEAAKARNIAAVRALIAQKVDVNEPQADGATALAWAAHEDDVEMAGLLIAAGADANIANDYGVTPLELACAKGSAAMVAKLLSGKADPNKAQWNGATPLMSCARSGSAEAVEALLKAKANPSAKESRRGQTALMWAAAQKHSAVVKALVKAGSEVNAKSQLPADMKPILYLTYGVYRRDPTTVDRFEAGDAHLDPTSSRGGYTALMFAAQQGDLDSARALVEGGANVNDVSTEYGSALVVAAASGHEPLALYLVEKGADPNVADGWGLNALHYSLRAGIIAIGMSRDRIRTDRYWHKPGLPELAKSLLAHGANPNARIGKGLPPFDYPFFARTTGNSMPQIRQPGATPFLLAAAAFDASMMKLLIEHGANPKLSTDEGTTPLMTASGMGRLEDLSPEEEAKALVAARMALELGNDVNAANQDGRNALGAAAFLGANSIVELLAGKGANLEMQDRYGQSALSIAKGLPAKITGQDKRFRGSGGHQSTEELLLKLGAKPIAEKN